MIRASFHILSNSFPDFHFKIKRFNRNFLENFKMKASSQTPILFHNLLVQDHIHDYASMEQDGVGSDPHNQTPSPLPICHWGAWGPWGECRSNARDGCSEWGTKVRSRDSLSASSYCFSQTALAQERESCMIELGPECGTY